MRRLFLVLTFIFWLFSGFLIPGKAATGNYQQAGGIGVIDWPVTAEHIQGVVVVRGSTPTSGLRYYEVDYALSSDAQQAWVLIQDGTAPIQDGILAIWDTTAIPDGVYNLRLLISQTNGEQSVTNMYNLLVNNSVTAEPTRPAATAWYLNLPGPTHASTNVVAAAKTTPAVFLSASPTPLPANPVEISSTRAFKALAGGAIFTITVFIIALGTIGIRHQFLGRK